MLIREKIGNLKSFETAGCTVDFLPVEWYETGKRILNKQTVSGKEVVLKFLAQAQNLQQDDVLYADEKTVIAVDIIACNVIIIEPATMYDMALICYEIGNKHLPLFYVENKIMLPYEAPIFRMLQAAGFGVKQERRKLLHPLKTSVAPHAHGDSESLFSKILQLTTAPDAT